MDSALRSVSLCLLKFYWSKLWCFSIIEIFWPKNNSSKTQLPNWTQTVTKTLLLEQWRAFSMFRFSYSALSSWLAVTRSGRCTLCIDMVIVGIRSNSDNFAIPNWIFQLTILMIIRWKPSVSKPSIATGTPVSPFKTDPNGDASNWPDGFGQLTMKGKRRMFSIGQFLRSKYDVFLSDSIREVGVRSSDRDRCIESTQLVLNGIYKPKGRWVWQNDELWQPLPVHTNPTYLDSVGSFK